MSVIEPTDFGSAFLSVFASRTIEIVIARVVYRSSPSRRVSVMNYEVAAFREV